jgi:hypothetical protein
VNPTNTRAVWRRKWTGPAGSARQLRARSTASFISITVTGGEKGDGYATSHFDGLTDDERDQAFDLLAREAEQVPETATRWLFHLDARRAEAVTLDQIAKRKGDPGGKNYIRQFELLEYTHDLQHQRDMLDEYPQIHELYKTDALQLIGRTPKNRQLHEFVRNLLLHETERDAIAEAAIAFLHMHQVPEETASEKAVRSGYFARLKSPSPQTRADAIREIQQQYPLPP